MDNKDIGVKGEERILCAVRPLRIPLSVPCKAGEPDEGDCLTPIGKIDNVDAEELREALGTGDVTVALSIE